MSKYTLFRGESEFPGIWQLRDAASERVATNEQTR